MSENLTWNPDKSQKQTLTWDPNKPQKPATELEGIVNRMRADNVPMARIASVIQTYKRNEYEKLKAESIYNQKKSGTTPGTTETKTESTEKTPDYKPYDEKEDAASTETVDQALNEYNKHSATSEQIAKNEETSRNYVDGLFDFKESREEEKWYETAQDYGTAILKNIWRGGTNINTGVAVDKALIDANQQKDFIQKKKDLISDTKSALYEEANPGMGPGWKWQDGKKVYSDEYKAFEKTLTEDQIREKAYEVHLNKLNSDTRQQNLNESLNDDVGIKENIEGVIGGMNAAKYLVPEKYRDGMTDDQAAKLAKAKEAREQLDNKIKQHVDKQNYYINNMDKAYAEMKMLSSESYRAEDRKRLEAIQKEAELIAKNPYYTTEEERSEARAQLQALQMERDEIISRFDADRERFETLQGISKQYRQGYMDTVNEGGDIKATDAELNKYLDSIGREYGITSQARNWVRGAAASLAGGIVDFADETLWAPLSIAEENFEDIPELFKPAIGVLQDAREISDKYGLGAVGDHLANVSEKMQNGVQAPPKISEIDSLEDFGEWAAHATASQLPNTALMISTGGASLYLMSASAAGNTMREMNKEMEMYANLPDGHPMKDFKYNFAQQYATAVITGAAEGLSEQITLRQLGKVGDSLSKSSGVKRGFMNYVKRNLFTTQGILNNVYDPIEEGATEAISQITGNLAMKYLSGDPEKMKNVNIWEGVSESFVSGAWMSGVVYKSPVFAANILSPFAASTSIDNLKQNSAEIMALTKQLENKQLTAEARNAIQDQIKEKVDYSNTILKNDIDNVDKMSSEEKQRLLDIASLQAKNDQRIDDISNDPSITEDMKNKMIADINLQQSQLTNEKNRVIAPYNKDRNDKILTKQIKSIEKKAKKMFGKALKVKRRTRDQAGQDFVEYKKQRLSQLDDSIVGIRTALNNGDITQAEYDAQYADYAAEIQELRTATINDAKYSNGFILENSETGQDEIIINEDQALESGAVNVAAHEFLHKVLQNTVRDNPQAAKVLATSLMQELAGIDINALEQSEYRTRLEAYRNQPESVQAEEVLTTFADAVKRGDLKMRKQTIGDSVRRVLQTVGLKNIKFNNAEDVYNFLGDYQRFADSRINRNLAIERGAKRGFAISESLKRKVLDARDKIVKKPIKTSIDNTFENEIQRMQDNPEFDDTDANAFMIAEMYNPLDFDGRVLPTEQLTIGARSILNKLKPYQDLPGFEQKRKQIVDDILNDPDTNRSIRSIIKTYDNNNTDGPNGEKVPLSGYIGSVLAKRGVSEAVNKHIKSGETFTQGDESLLNLGQEDTEIINEDRTTIIDSRDSDGALLVPTDVQENLVQTIMPDLGVKLPAIDAARSKNKAVTPLIAALKKAFGVKNGPLHKAMLNMLGKTTTEVREFLNNPEMKNVVLSVLPTSWLAKNIPNAVEKLVIQEDGTKIWTTDHVGRTKGTKPGQIDFWRSTEEGPYIGMTDGKQKIRRNPNAVEDVDFNEILLMEDNNTITELKRGNKNQGKLGMDAMAMAMAQEFGMELFDQDLANDGPLTDLFEGRQELFDRILAENYKSEIIGQMERGAVKMSRDIKPGDNASNVALMTQFINQYNRDLSRPENVDNFLSNLSQSDLQFITRSGFMQFIVRPAEQAYKAPLNKFLQDNGFDSIYNMYSKDNSQSRAGKQQMARAAEILIDVLPPSLVKALGSQFFGLHKRLLDPADKKIDKAKSKIAGERVFQVDENGNLVRGEYNDLMLKWREKANQADQTFDGPFNLDDVHIFQSQSGIIKGIKDILNKPETDNYGRNEKIAEIESKFGEQIKAANAANPQAMAFALAEGLKNIAKITNAKDQLEALVGMMRLLEGASNNVGGTRGLIRYAAMEVHGPSTAVYRQGDKYFDKLTAKQKQEYENGNIEINKDHPYYRQAVIEAKGDESKIVDLLKDKLEHQDPSANVNRENMKSLVAHADVLMQFPSEADFIINNLMDEIMYNTFQFEGISNPKINSDIQDKALTSTNPDAYGRLTLAALKPVASVMVSTDTFSPDGIQDLIANKIERAIQITAPDPIAKQVADRIKNKSVERGRTLKFSKENKGITILDFDDTLATSESLVRYTTPDGTTGTLNAEQYAATYEDLLDKGYKFDFSEFNKVVKGKIAPLFQKALKLQSKFGPDNMFVLTARPMAAQKSIFDFLKANGLNIPIQNITGLGNSTAEAKALWVADKVGDGYNDFYFADDALQNVQAVKNVLDQFDVKSKVQQARVKFSKDADTIFNDILEETFGVKSEAEFSRAKAKQRGKKKGRFDFFIPPSAEDFKGLLYKILAKGKLGERQMAWFQENLIEPFARGIREIDNYTRDITNKYKTLTKAFPQITKKLSQILPGTEFTYDQAARVYLWNKAGFDIPGLSKADLAAILKAVNADPMLLAFANKLGSITKNGFPAPTESWIAENIKSDLNDIINNLRKEFLADWIEKKNIIFSEKNMNKLEAIHGPRYVEALRDILYRMENGTNRTFGNNRLVNRFANWVNNSVGAIMFFNMRSAVLQTLSTVNFINWEDNNLYAAAKAFANQKQYWKDFITLWNSDMLVQRRKGLRTSVSQSELASAIRGAKNPVRAAFAYLMKIGFTPTQIADSFAIASGGATFYRNRINKYLKEGMTQAQAEQQAFNDFQNIAEETQQSSRPDMISQQQASVLGRIILAFQNTPMQYARLTKKALLDLVNGRGSVKSNISKILYYSTIQNLIFGALQKGLFAIAFEDDDEDEDKKKKREKKELSLLNGMLDGFLRGMGVGGAIVSTAKNVIIKFLEEEKKDFRGDNARVLIEFLNLSPTIGSKIRKLNTALNTYKYKKKVIKEMDKNDIDNPIWQAIGNVISAITNLPADRAVNKILNVKEALDAENEMWQRIALIMGWNTWDLGVENKDVEAAKERIKQRREKENAEKKKKKKEEERKRKEKERKEREAREVQCSAFTRKGKGPRCKNRTENKNGRCYAHQ
jgi:uncharacterized protein (UPF0297 family)